jgi:hypothetical protein
LLTLSEYEAKLPDFSKYIIGYPINPHNITRQEVIEHRHRVLDFHNNKNKAFALYEPKDERDKLVYDFVMDVQCSYDNVIQQDKDPKNPRRLCHDCLQLHNGFSGGDCLECAWEQFQPYWEKKKNHTYHSKESYFLIMCEFAEQYHLEELAKQRKEKEEGDERERQGLPRYDWRKDLRETIRVDAPTDEYCPKLKWKVKDSD